MFTRYFILIFFFSFNLLAAYQPVTTVSGTVAVSNFPAVQVVSGTSTVSGTISVSNFPALQSVSGTVSQNGVWSVTANAGTNLNTSALALESGGNLATIATRTPSLGQATMANSSPVVIASNQSTLPVSGTVSQNGNWNINNISGTVSLPTGAATSANQTNVQAVDGGTPPASALVVGGVTAGGVFQTFETNASGHLNIADGGGSITVDNAGTFAVQAAQSGGWTVTANAGTNLNTSALALESGGNLAAASTSLGLLDNAVAGSELQVDVVASLPAGTNNIGDVDVLSVPANMSINQTQVNGVAVSTGNGTAGTGVQRVTIASDNTAFNVLNTEVRPSTATTTSVAASATSVTCLASNAARRMATFFNDSTATVYLKFGATASTSSHAVQILGGGYYEMPYPTYTGIIDCIWASATGSMRVTEY